jgi:hypothetical protein
MMHTKALYGAIIASAVSLLEVLAHPAFTIFGRRTPEHPPLLLRSSDLTHGTFKR